MVHIEWCVCFRCYNIWKIEGVCHSNFSLFILQSSGCIHGLKCRSRVRVCNSCSHSLSKVLSRSIATCEKHSLTQGFIVELGGVIFFFWWRWWRIYIIIVLRRRWWRWCWRWCWSSWFFIVVVVNVCLGSRWRFWRCVRRCCW